MRSAKPLILIVFLVFSAMAFAEASVEVKAGGNTPPSYILCRNKKTVRTLRVEKGDKEYVALYTKSGIDREVGRAQNMSSCVKIVENIRENLEKASWKCRAADNVRITSYTSGE